MIKYITLFSEGLLKKIEDNSFVMWGSTKTPPTFADEWIKKLAKSLVLTKEGLFFSYQEPDYVLFGERVSQETFIEKCKEMFLND
jgi:hypothetical protein